MRYLIYLFSLLATSLSVAPLIAQNNLPPEVREMARKVMMPVVYQVPGMDKVKVVHAETLERFSPITYLQKNAAKIPPMLLARAGRDEVPTMDDSIDRFVKEALAANAALTFANHPHGVHGFDNQNDDERSQEIIRAALEFMKVHLGIAPSSS